jgi:hypothetical protein
MKLLIACASTLVLGLGIASAQQGRGPGGPPAGGAPASPPASATAAIDGKTLSIKYSAPSVRGRQIFGPGGLVSKDRTYPAWRAGANSATAFHTDADLDLGGLSVPKGDYTLFVNVGDPDNWELIVNKQTGQWGLSYDQGQDLGRAKMKMSKPGAMIELLKWSINSSGAKAGALQLEWENHIATVPFTVK